MAVSTPAAPEVLVMVDAERLASDVADRTITALRRAQDVRGRAILGLTAGSIMEQVWSAIAASPARELVDWSRVDVCWADERFVPTDSSDRNEPPANRLLWDLAPFSAARRYPMPASDGPVGDDLDAAAAYYEQSLAGIRRPGETGQIPNIDVVLLGVGPDGHCASLFPNHPSSQASSPAVIAVRNSPKPPPLRLSLSFEGLNSAREIWVVVSGAGKADAVASAIGGAAREAVPSAGARGTSRTLWLIDFEAASKLG
jgi:6-phosphogluconolactonase